MADPRLDNHLFRSALERSRRDGRLFGPFHRKRSASQSRDNDAAQIRSGLLWGSVPQNGKCPTAQAYFGPLGDTEQGIEFVTPIRPQQDNLPNGFGANWYVDDTPFTGLIEGELDSVAAITIVVTRHNP